MSSSNNLLTCPCKKYWKIRENILELGNIFRENFGENFLDESFHENFLENGHFLEDKNFRETKMFAKIFMKTNIRSRNFANFCKNLPIFVNIHFSHKLKKHLRANPSANINFTSVHYFLLVLYWVNWRLTFQSILTGKIDHLYFSVLNMVFEFFIYSKI